MRLPILLFAFLSFFGVSAQDADIVDVRYWIDQDPGFGLGESLVGNFTNANEVSQSFDVLSSISSNLSVGSHLLGIRTKDSDGKWSHTNLQNFHVLNLPVDLSIVAAEYWVDGDQTFGEMTSTGSFSPINVLVQEFIANADLNPGSHLIGVRTLDSEGRWSHTNFVRFNVIETPVNSSIVEYEVIIQQDPLFGNETVNVFIPNTPGTTVSDELDAVLPAGIIEGETVNAWIRSKDSQGKWSHTNYIGNSLVYGEPDVNPEPVDVTSCVSFTTPDGTDVTADTTFTETSFMGSGFETVTYIVDITTVDTDINFNETTQTIEATATSATFQWLDCNNGFLEIEGATNALFAPDDVGSYAVEVSQNGCVAISECTEVVVSVEDLLGNRTELISVFPNPTSDVLNIKLHQSMYPGLALVYDNTGKLVIQEFISSSHTSLDVSNLTTGVYYLRIGSGNISLVIAN